MSSNHSKQSIGESYIPNKRKNTKKMTVEPISIKTDLPRSMWLRNTSSFAHQSQPPMTLTNKPTMNGESIQERYE